MVLQSWIVLCELLLFVKKTYVFKRWSGLIECWDISRLE